MEDWSRDQEVSTNSVSKVAWCNFKNFHQASPLWRSRSILFPRMLLWKVHTQWIKTYLVNIQTLEFTDSALKHFGVFFKELKIASHQCIVYRVFFVCNTFSQNLWHQRCSKDFFFKALKPCFRPGTEGPDMFWSFRDARKEWMIERSFS